MFVGRIVSWIFHWAIKSMNHMTIYIFLFPKIISIKYSLETIGLIIKLHTQFHQFFFKFSLFHVISCIIWLSYNSEIFPIFTSFTKSPFLMSSFHSPKWWSWSWIPIIWSFVFEKNLHVRISDADSHWQTFVEIQCCIMTSNRDHFLGNRIFLQFRNWIFKFIYINHTCRINWIGWIFDLTNSKNTRTPKCNKNFIHESVKNWTNSTKI